MFYKSRTTVRLFLKPRQGVSKWNDKTSYFSAGKWSRPRATHTEQSLPRLVKPMRAAAPPADSVLNH
jgi:hypothetical protein